MNRGIGNPAGRDEFVRQLVTNGLDERRAHELWPLWLSLVALRDTGHSLHLVKEWADIVWMNGT